MTNNAHPPKRQLQNFDKVKPIRTNFHIKSTVIENSNKLQKKLKEDWLNNIYLL